MAVNTGAANHVLIPGAWNGYSGARVRETVTTDKNSIPGGSNRLGLLHAPGPDSPAPVVRPDVSTGTCMNTVLPTSRWARSRWQCASTHSSIRVP